MNYDQFSAQTKSLLHHVTEDIGLFDYKLNGLNSSSQFAQLSSTFRELSQKLESVNSNCDRLSVLINTIEPYSRRSQARLSLDQILFECKQCENNLRSLESKKRNKEHQVVAREELLSHDFGTNASYRNNNTNSTSVSVKFDAEVEHYSRMSSIGRQIDDLVASGLSSLGSLKEQGMTMKSAHRRVIDVMNTLGLSNTVMRLIERRTHQDKILFWVCVFATFLFMFAIWRYFA